MSEERQWDKPKESRRQEIIKTKAKVNEIKRYNRKDQ